MMIYRNWQISLDIQIPPEKVFGPQNIPKTPFEEAWLDVYIHLSLFVFRHFPTVNMSKCIISRVKNFTRDLHGEIYEGHELHH